MVVLSPRIPRQQSSQMDYVYLNPTEIWQDVTPRLAAAHLRIQLGWWVSELTE